MKKESSSSNVTGTRTQMIGQRPTANPLSPLSLSTALGSTGTSSPRPPAHSPREPPTPSSTPSLSIPSPTSAPPSPPMSSSPPTPSAIPASLRAEEKHSPSLAKERKELSARSKTNYSWDGFAGPFGELFPNELFTEFSKLINLSRDLNTQLPVPEIVFIGHVDHGKSSLLEALVGHPFTLVDKGPSTLRPLFFQLVNNLACSTPKVTIKHDPYLEDLNYDMEVNLPELEDEIERRNVLTDTPIYLTYEYRNCFNLTFIDTPGLSTFPEEKKEIMEIVLGLIRPSHRFIVCVEKCAPWDQIRMLDFIKRVDPKLSRTVFGFAGFNKLLSHYSTTLEVNHYLSHHPADHKIFYLTLIPGNNRDNYQTNQQFQEGVRDLIQQDLNILEQLNYDRKFIGKIGVSSLKKQLLEMSWKRYQDIFPEVLRTIKKLKNQIKTDMGFLDETHDGLTETNLRAISNSFLGIVLSSLEKLINGTNDGNPGLNGLTLEEERELQGAWLDASNRPIKGLKDIPVLYADTKLYGGQQLERLLLEFKAIADRTSISEITIHDVATATGPHKLRNFSNFAWAASDIAQQRSEKAFRPLIEQLFKRALFIMRRLVTAADYMVHLEPKGQDQERIMGVIPHFAKHHITDYPFFINSVHQHYLKYIEKLAESAKKKCLEEFYCTRIIHWEMMNDIRGLPSEPEQAKKMVVVYAAERFGEIKKRLIKNVMLKVYNFFVVPLQTELWGEMTSHVASYSSETLEEVFEVDATKAKLEKEKDELTSILSKLKQSEKFFLESLSKFSHPKGLLDK